MIEVKNLSKRYGGKTAVNGISFTVQDGEVLGFLGPNGAGKTTTMNMITGYISSTGGTVTVDGREILADPLGVKAAIGYLPEQPPLYLDMTVWEYLSFLCALKRVKGDRKTHIAEIAKQCGIDGQLKRRIGNLSKGYRQRVGLAQALLGRPRLVILDEPTVGLDPKQIIEIRSLIRDLGREHTVILSSHILSEVKAVCDRVIVIADGSLVADDTPDCLTQRLSTRRRLSLRVDGPEDDVAALLTSLSGAISLERLGEKEDGSFDYLLEAEQGKDLRRDVFHSLAEHGWPLLGLESEQLSLEDVFLQLTSADGDEQAQEEASAE